MVSDLTLFYKEKCHLLERKIVRRRGVFQIFIYLCRMSGFCLSIKTIP